jgi:hypothetical protein
MAPSGDQDSSRKGATTLVAIAGLFTTLAAAIITSVVANQGVQASANAQRAGQIEDQRRAVYADFISSTGAMCKSLTPDQIDITNVNSAYLAVLTQRARLKLIAPSDLSQPAQALVDYVLKDALQVPDKTKPGVPEGCEPTKYEDLIDSFLQSAQDEF